MLKLENLFVNHGEIQAVKDVTIDVPSGSVTTVIGSNGAGKTTMLKAISGLYKCKSGEVNLFGENIVNLDSAKIVAKVISQVPEGRGLFPRMTIYDNLLVGAHLQPKRGIRNDIDRVFHYFPVLSQKRKLTAKSLSGGEQQMLAFGRALMSKPKFLLLDEPSTGLSPLIEKKLMSTVLELAKQEDLGVLLIEQNATLALSAARYAYVLETGSVAFEGGASELANDPRVKAAYLGL